MRVKELADLTGTTVRTIRYYHQIGLLPVPAVHSGHRDYELPHVARLTRIRWLTQAGVPLSRVIGILGSAHDAGLPEEARQSVLADLEATLVTIDDQLDQLRRQRDRVERLIASAAEHEHLSPLPPAAVRFYADLERRATDERVRRVIRRERDFMELAYYRGEIPAAAAAVYEGLTEAGLAESLAAYGHVADRQDSGHEPTAEELEQLSAVIVDRIRRHLGADFPRLARTVDLDLARRAADLYVQLEGDRDRRANSAIADALIAALEEAAR